MPDRQLNRLQLKYLSAINLIGKLGGRLQATGMLGRKLFIKAEMDSQDAKKQVWDQIKLCDPGYPDLIADITVAEPPEPEPPPTKAPEFDAAAPEPKAEIKYRDTTGIPSADLQWSRKGPEPEPEQPPEVPPPGPEPEPEDHPWPEPPHAKSEKPVRVHTVRGGDTLIRIAIEYYGSPDRYMEIYKANRDILADPEDIFPGQELVIPYLEGEV
jgi:nucleoid-associated protein YgaU